MTKRKPKELHKKPGPKNVITDDVIQKLCEMFSYGCTDEEACRAARISPATLYNYQKENPWFVEEKELRKEDPFIKARLTIVKSLDNPVHAQWYAERKKKNEFGTKTSVEYTNAESESLTNAEIIKNAFLALPPEERAAIVSEVNNPETPTEGSQV